MEAEIRAAILTEVRTQIQAELEQEQKAQRGHPIDAAISLIKEAAQGVLDEAAVLKAQGHRLVARQRTSAVDTSMPVAKLLERTHFLCRDAMVHVDAELNRGDRKI